MERITRRRLLRDGAGAGAALAVAGSPALRAAAAAATPGAPLYAAGFKSLTDEVRLPRVPVDGDLPRWLRGVLLRNGPALFEIGEQKLNHWFDGLAMLHAFSFGEGQVSYANRFLRSSNYESWKRDGEMAYSEFGTDPIPDPCRAIYSGVSTLPVLGPVPNANVSIEQLGRTFQAHTEIPVPVRFNPESLKTLGVDSEVPNGRLGTAHPHHDPRTGERFSYECELVLPSGLRIVSERKGKRRELAFIPQARPGYLHSFALTERYVAVFTQPWEFDLTKFLSPTRGPIATNYVWDGSVPAKIYLVDRKRGGVAAEFELDPFFVFHHINAFDDGDKVVMDVCAHKDSSAVEALYLKNLRSPSRQIPQAAARRLTVDPSSGKVRIARPRRGQHRAAAEGLRELQRAPVPLRLRRRRPQPGQGRGLHQPARQARHQARRDDPLARGRLLSRRGGLRPPAGLRSPPGRGRRRAPVGRLRRPPPHLLPARPRRSRHGRAGPSGGSSPHPLRLPRSARRRPLRPCEGTLGI